MHPSQAVEEDHLATSEWYAINDKVLLQLNIPNTVAEDHLATSECYAVEDKVLLR